MDPENTALPTDGNVAAGEQATTDAAAATTEQTGAEQTGEAKPEGEEGGDKEPAKKEKTPEQREIERLRRRVDNLTRQKYELRASVPQQAQEKTPNANDDEPVTLSRAELERQIEERAAQRAPSIAEQQAVKEHRQAVVSSLEKEWGKQEFDAKAADLDDVFGGLADAHGRPKPATDAIFEADNPKAVIEYLTDPDNADEAERIASLSPIRAGRAIALLDAKLKAAPDKPQASKAPKPLEAIRGQGSAEKDPSRMTDAEFADWRRRQIKQRS